MAMVKQSRRAVASLGLLLVSLGLIGCNRDSASAHEPADRIVIVKSAHTLSLMKEGQIVRTYRVALGRDPRGAKVRLGDHKTPEGEYLIDEKKSHSRFHLALHVSYPNETDRERSAKLGVNPGGDVEIHGIENGLGWIGSLHRSFDWTDGCIAVTDGEIEEIWNAVPIGTPVEIRP